MLAFRHELAYTSLDGPATVFSPDLLIRAVKSGYRVNEFMATVEEWAANVNLSAAFSHALASNSPPMLWDIVNINLRKIARLFCRSFEPRSICRRIVAWPSLGQQPGETFCRDADQT